MKNTNIKAELRIMGEEFNIHEITKKLSVPPTQYWYVGDEIRKSGKNRTYTAWIYGTEAKETLDINTQASIIEEVFASKIEKIAKLKEQYNLDISIDFVIVIENEMPPAICFQQKFIQFAAEIGARIDIDTYVN